MSNSLIKLSDILNSQDDSGFVAVMPYSEFGKYS